MKILKFLADVIYYILVFFSYIYDFIVDEIIIRIKYLGNPEKMIEYQVEKLGRIRSRYGETKKNQES